jgi:TM2 domain-containing membrane protein YozV
MGRFAAALFSLVVPGIGQFYNGYFWKALAFLTIGLILVFVTSGAGLLIWNPIAAIEAFISGGNRSRRWVSRVVA